LSSGYLIHPTKDDAPHEAGHSEVALHAQDACPFALLHTVR